MCFFEPTWPFYFKFNLSKTIHFLKRPWFLYVLSKYQAMFKVLQWNARLWKIPTLKIALSSPRNSLFIGDASNPPISKAFNFTYRYINDVLSINNARFAEFLPLIYPPELEVKEITDTASSASFLDLYLEFDDSGQLSTKIYDKRDDFNFKIINFPNMCSNIPASPAYGVYISQLIRYARASSNYSDFLKRHLHLRNRLLDQGYKKIRLIRSLKKFIFRYQDLVEIYSVSAETIISDGFSYSENV